jgi:hypothetical protein
MIDDALELMAPRLSACDARVEYTPPDADLHVTGRARAAAAGRREPHFQCARRDGRARCQGNRDHA